MKIKQLLSTRAVALMSLLFVCNSLFGQIITVTETNPDSLTACLDTQQFTLTIRNTSSSDTAKNLSILLNLPIGINYAGGLTNSTELDVSDLNEPIFGIASIAPNTTVVVTYLARADCSVIPVGNAQVLNFTNITTINYTRGSASETAVVQIPVSYNVYYARLVITNIVDNGAPPFTFTLSVGVTQGPNVGLPQPRRQIEIQNSGFGSIDTVRILITPEPEIQYLNFYGANDDQPLIFNTLTNGDIEIIIAGNALLSASNNSGDDINLFDPGEVIRINEEFRVVSCNTGQNAYKVTWGCNGVACNQNDNNSSANSNIGTTSATPTISLTTGNTEAVSNYCGVSGDMKFNYRNTATGASNYASSVQLEIRTAENNMIPNGFNLTNIRLNSFVVPSHLIDLVPNPTVTTTGQIAAGLAYRIDLTRDNIGGLGIADLDGDGFFDDLQPGQTAAVLAQLNIERDSFDLEACPFRTSIQFGIPIIRYQNQCGGQFIQTFDNNTNGYFYNNSPSNLTNLVSAPSDFVEDSVETFRFCTGTWSLSTRNLKCPIDSNYAVIYLPPGYTLAPDNNAQWFSSLGDSLDLTASQQGDSIIIFGGGFSSSNAFDWTGCYEIDLILSCANNPTIQPESTVSWTMNYLCDTCDVVMKRACSSSLTIVNHATCLVGGGAGCTGIATTSFDAERRSFGWTDYTLSEHVTLNTPGLNLKAAYPHDSIRLLTRGKVMGTNFNSAYVQVVYFANDTLIKWLGGRFNTSTGASFVASAPQLSIISGNIYEARFDVPTACVQGLTIGQDIELETFWQVQLTTHNSSGFYEIPNFRSQFNNVISPTSEYNCESWGTTFKLYGIGTFPLMSTQPLPGFATSGCATRRVTIQWRNIAATGEGNRDDFPNEFRHLGRINNPVKILLPPGYSYRDNSAKINYISYGTSYVIDSVGNVADPTTNGDTLIFTPNIPLIDKGAGFEGVLPQPSFYLDLVPDCSVPPTVLNASTEFRWSKFDYTSDSSKHLKIREVNPGFQLRHNNPNLTMSTGLTTVDAFTRTARWNVDICNLATTQRPNIGQAENVWLDIDPSQFNSGSINFSSISIVSPPTPLVQEAYGNGSTFVEVGTIPIATCRKIAIVASFEDCFTDALDTLHLLSGWNCAGYPEPEDAETATCQIGSANLLLRYKSADMAVTLTAPSGQFNPCDTIPYTMDFRSTGQGNMYNIDVWANLPDGASITNARYLYTLSSGTVTSLPAMTTDFSGSNATGWHLSQIVPDFIANDGGGFVGVRDTTRNRIRVLFNVVPGCDYDPSQPIVFNASGITNCNDTLPFLFNQGFTISGFNNLSNLEVDLNATDTLFCTETMVFTATVTNGQTASGGADSLKITVPSGFDYVALPALPNPPNDISTDASQNTVLTWLVAPLGASATRTYSFRLSATDTTTGCNSNTISAAIEFSQTTNCNGSNCISTATISDDNAPVVICCPRCDINAAFTFNAVCLGNDSVCFVLADPTTLTSGYSHQWNFGNGVTSTLAEPCHLYTAEGSYTVTHTVTDSTGCTEITDRTVSISERGDYAIELLGCNPFCHGDTVYLTVDGVYDSIVWLRYPLPGTLVGTTDTLVVTQSGTYNAVVYSGSCESDCLAITVTEQTTPEIEIGDTTICVGDSITVCAGGGFASYEWTYNGTILNDTDSCIVVSEPGTYTVTVGQQQDFTCCMCLATDTFVVTEDSVIVNVPDGIICRDDTLEICADVLSGAPAFTYSWSPTNATTECINVTSSGTYSVTVTDRFGCSATDSATIALQTLPDPDFNGPDTICINERACFEAVVDSALHKWVVTSLVDNTITYQSTQQNQDTICLNFPEAGTYVISHTISNECGDTTHVDTVVVIPPIEACIVLLGQNPFCEGDRVCMTINDPFNQVSTIEWYKDSVLVFTGDTLCVTEPGTYSAKVVDNNGCVNECMCIVLNRVAGPSAVLPDRVGICPGGSRVIQALVNFNPTEYFWYRNNVPFAFGTTSITVNQVGTYRLTVRNANGCEASDSVTVISRPTPPITITQNRSGVCPNEPVTFTATANNPDYTYQWFRIPVNGFGTPVGPAMPILGATTRTYTTFDGSNANYYAVVTDGLTGCSATTNSGTIRPVLCRFNPDGPILEFTVAPTLVTEGIVSIYYDAVDVGATANVKVELQTITGAVLAKYQLDMLQSYQGLDVTNVAAGTYLLNFYRNGIFVQQSKVIVVK